jgi:hypothetical protein
VRAGPYQTAARQLPNSEAAIRTALLGAIASSAAGGHTLRVAQDDWLVPLLSEVHVLYDAQFSNRRLRVQKNVRVGVVVGATVRGGGPPRGGARGQVRRGASDLRTPDTSDSGASCVPR